VSVKSIVKSKNTWIGAVIGVVAGNWILGTTARLTGVNVSLPKIRNGS
jgi:hypothetical protein